MKGLNTMVVNQEQMCAIAQEWWDRMTYGTKDVVIEVAQYDGGKHFEVRFEQEPIIITKDES